MAAANPPKDPGTRRRRNAPARGDWRAAPAVGWQHGKVPEPPDGLKKETIEAWHAWFGAWFAANWGPEDLPGLRTVAQLFDEAARGNGGASGRAELRLWMDQYGITPKGQQDRRWRRPAGDEHANGRPVGRRTPYAHLRVAK